MPPEVAPFDCDKTLRIGALNDNISVDVPTCWYATLIIMPKELPVPFATKHDIDESLVQPESSQDDCSNRIVEE
jgi:hypothetical protein